MSQRIILLVETGKIKQSVTQVRKMIQKFPKEFPFLVDYAELCCKHSYDETAADCLIKFLVLVIGTRDVPESILGTWVFSQH